MKKIMIFGATGGIGMACAKLLDNNEEIQLICTGHNEEKLDCLKKLLSDRHLFFGIDVSVSGSIERLIKNVCETVGTLDGIVFAIGIEGVRPIRVMSDEFFMKVFTINCGSFMQLCKCMSSKRYSNDGSSIVAISSLASITLCYGEGAYGVSKAALDATVKQAAMELVTRRIRVNAILPASTDTEMISKARERVDRFDEKTKEIQPLGIIDPDAVAYLVEFLLSDKAAFITGDCIPISAGRKFF